MHEREMQIANDKHLLLARNLGAALDLYALNVLSVFSFSAATALAGGSATEVKALM
jgi:hypothetical protein